MIYGYARVSTTGQAKNGNSLTEQVDKLKSNGVSEENIFIDSYTGTKIDRPQFSKLLNLLKSGDTLVICKLDRFSRSLSQASKLINDLIEQGITINVLNLGILSNDSVNTLMRNMLLAFAQFERDMIVERTQEGKSIAKLRPDFKEGRPKLDKDKINNAMELLDSFSYRKVSKITGISISSLERYHDKYIKETVNSLRTQE